MKDLIFKYCRGEASEKEIVILYKWISLSKKNRDTFIEIKNFCVERDVYRVKFLGGGVVKKGRALLYEKLGWLYVDKDKPVFNGILAFNIACIALFISLFSLFIINYQNKSAQKIADIYLEEVVVTRVDRRATLSLATGEIIVLGSNQNIKNGSIIVEDKGNSAVIEIDTNDYEENNILNSVSTNDGGDYEVILPDGSKVLLNSKSSISFPNRFSKLERVVYLSGEALFNVMHSDLAPFIVICNDFTTKVLGTEFVVSTYHDDISKVSLLSGQIEFCSKDSTFSKILNPNYRVSYSKKDGVYMYDKFDSYKYQAFKDGYFYFSQSSINEVLKELERWFNIKINLESDKYNNLMFNGKISKEISLLSIIDQLKALYDFKYYIKNEQLMIK